MKGKEFEFFLKNIQAQYYRYQLIEKAQSYLKSDKCTDEDTFSNSCTLPLFRL